MKQLERLIITQQGEWWHWTKIRPRSQLCMYTTRMYVLRNSHMTCARNKVNKEVLVNCKVVAVLIHHEILSIAFFNSLILVGRASAQNPFLPTHAGPFRASRSTCTQSLGGYWVPPATTAIAVRNRPRTLWWFAYFGRGSVGLSMQSSKEISLYPPSYAP